MTNRDNNEMEQIQRGLEAFLEKELNMDVDGNSQEAIDSEGGYKPYAGQEEFYSGEPYPEEITEYYGEGEEPYAGQEEPYPEEEPESFDQREVRLHQGAPQQRRFRQGNMAQDKTGAQLKGRQARSKSQQARSESRQARPGNQQAGSKGGQTRPENQQARSESRRARPENQHVKSESPSAQEDTAMARNSSGKGASKGTRKKGAPNGGAARKGASAEPPGHKKKRKKKFRLLKLLIFLAVIIGLLGFALYQLVGSVYGKMNFEEIQGVASQPMEEEGVVNILLIGNDSRKNGTDGRSDAMILLSVSSKTKTIYMTSLLRDMYVDIPGRDGNRLNAAYSFGGPELLMETIEENFDISVNRYVSVNFEAFANLIDAVEGVDLELSREEIEYVNGYLVEYNTLTGREQGTDNMDPDAAGLVHLNGPQALAYCRNRYIGTDFGRTERQRKVLTAAIKKLPSAILNDYEGLMEGILPNLTTNLTQNECFQLSLMAGKLLTYEIVSDSLPQPGTYTNATIRKMAVLEVDFDANIRYLKEKIYGEAAE